MASWRQFRLIQAGIQPGAQTGLKSPCPVWGLLAAATHTTEPDQCTLTPTVIHYEFNAVQNEELLKREGQLHALHRILQDLKARGDALPQEMHVSVSVPEAQWLQQAESGLEKINRLAAPACFADRLKCTVLRKMTGIDTPLQPVRYARDADYPEQKMHVTVNLSGLSAQDVDRLDQFIQRKMQKSND
jgi:hypothetical protein